MFRQSLYLFILSWREEDEDFSIALVAMLDSDLESTLSMLSYCWNAQNKVDAVPVSGLITPDRTESITLRVVSLILYKILFDIIL